MHKTFAYILLTSLCCQYLSFGDQLFIGIAETDSFDKLELSIEAFARTARKPELKTIFRRKFAEITALPEIKGFDSDRRIRIIQTLDPQEPLSGVNPANIAILPILDGGEKIEKMFAAAYKNSSYWRSEINLYETPLTTNLYQTAATMKSGRFILVSRSKNALLWISENKKLLNAAPLEQKGNIKLLLNAPRLGAILNAKLDPRWQEAFKVSDILQECETCSITVNIEAQSAALTIRATPFDGSPMMALIRNLKQPDQTLWASVPKNSFLQSISRCDNPEVFNRFAFDLREYLIPALKEFHQNAALAGERVHYLAPSSDNKGLVFVRIDKIKEIATLQQQIAELDKLATDQNMIWLEKETTESANQPIRYKVKINENMRDDGNTTALQAVSTLFLRHAWLEMQITSNRLVSVLGHKGAAANAVNAINSATPPQNLLQEIYVRNANIGAQPLTGTKVQASGLLSFLASIIPHVTREQITMLPQPGYGVTLGVQKPEENQFIASLQISADEVATLSEISKNYGALIQKVLVSMLMKSIEKETN